MTIEEFQFVGKQTFKDRFEKSIEQMQEYLNTNQEEAARSLAQRFLLKVRVRMIGRSFRLFH